MILFDFRRMFPSLQLEVSGLDPEARYFVMLEMSLSSGSRFKYSKSEWLPVGNAEPQLSPQTRIALHPDSPARGSYWTSQPILFNKIRLTNNTMDQAGNVSSIVLYTKSQFHLQFNGYAI